MTNSILSSMLLVALAWSCYPEGPEYVDQLDVVYTNYDEGFDFSDKGTFSVPDSVLKISGQNTNDPEFVNPVYGDVIIAQIRENMTNYGWSEVDADEDPDVIILPSSMSTTTLHYHYNWNYWDWYYPGWGAGMNWYYPGYYPAYVSGYSTGTVFIQMTYPDGTSPTNNNVPVVWNSVIDGLLQGSTENLNERFRTNINQAFVQSPYLDLN